MSRSPGTWRFKFEADAGEMGQAVVSGDRSLREAMVWIARLQDPAAIYLPPRMFQRLVDDSDCLKWIRMDRSDGRGTDGVSIAYDLDRFVFVHSDRRFRVNRPPKPAPVFATD